VVGRQLLCLALSGLFCTISFAGQKTSATSPGAEHKFVTARRLMSEGSLSEARKLVLEGLKLSPDSVEGYNLLGILYTQEKDYIRSATAFEHALKIDPRSTVTHNNLGSSYISQNRTDLAKKEYLATLRLDPHNRDANYNLGRLALTERQAELAIAYFRQVQPPDVPTSMNLISADLMAGRTKDATTLAAQISDQNKNDARVHFSLGVLLAQGKLYPPAIQELEIADAMQPGTFEILYNLGQAYSLNQNNVIAEGTLQRALRVKPESTAVLYSLGKLYYTEGRNLQALQVLMRAHKLAPQSTDIIFLLARLSMVEKYFEDAIPLLQEGIKIDPKRPDLHAALGDCYFTGGKTDEAIREFQTLIDLAPTAGSYAFMGLCYRHLGRYDEARKYLMKGLQLDPDDPACLFNLGFIAARRGDMQEAENCFQSAFKANPNYDDALYELAGVKMKEGKFQEAVSLLRQCLELNPNRTETYYRLATAERALHQTEAAERDFRIFETMAKNGSEGPYPFQSLFDYLDQKMGLAPQAQAKVDLAGLQMEFSKHPDGPRNLYLLAEAYLRLGRTEEAKKVLDHLDDVSGEDPRTALEVGVLLARYHLIPDAMRHFKAAVATDPSSDDAKYDLANVYFEQQDYANARHMLDQISAHGREDEPYLALLGDIDTHLGRLSEAQTAYTKAIYKSPDNDVHYLSLALSQLSGGDTIGAGKTLHAGLSRVPDSGRIAWGLGVLSVMERQRQQAEEYFDRALDLLPDWPSAYSALAVFYLSTGQATKARAVFQRYQEIFPRGPFDTKVIEKELAVAEERPQALQAITPQMQSQFLLLALALADQGPQ
jgi:tetratricopeptide (TPR) repeat protein